MITGIEIENRLMTASDNSAMYTVDDKRGNAYIIEVVDREMLLDEELDAIDAGDADGYIYGNIVTSEADYLCDVPYRHTETIRDVLIRMGMDPDAHIISRIPEDVIPEDWETCDEDPDHIARLNDAVRAWVYRTVYGIEDYEPGDD